ncbi:hypothetical protein BC833DRAFT_207638 [Globomyces pollinis-pini]|nr:hypothetical protein BC833DRAFT_207638 [Globomyces pollinis-pini]
MLKLVYVLTKVLENIFCIGMGFGMVYWSLRPAFNTNGPGAPGGPSPPTIDLGRTWRDLSIIIIPFVNISVGIRSFLIASRMHKLAVSTKKNLEEIEVNYRKAKNLIHAFRVLGIITFLLVLIAFIGPQLNRTRNLNGIKFFDLFCEVAVLLMPYQTFIYCRIFFSIRKIRFLNVGTSSKESDKKKDKQVKKKGTNEHQTDKEAEKHDANPNADKMDGSDVNKPTLA